MMYTTDTMTDTVGGSLGDSSLLLQKTQRPFDVREESQVIGLLKLVHQSAIDPDIKNHLRDLIFSYRQTPTSAGLQSICDAFAPLGVVIVNDTPQTQKPPTLSNPVAKKQPAANPMSKIGSQRPLPVFKMSKPSSITEEVQKRPSSWTMQSALHTADPSPVRVMHREHTTELQAKAVSQQPQPQKGSETIAQELHSDEHEHGPSPVSYEAITARIKEIKHIVNEKVGNPINLIDANNEVGREYMDALLEAMKRSNGGLPQELSAAMDRLEHAFEMVQKNIFSAVKGANAAVHDLHAQKQDAEAKKESEPVGIPAAVKLEDPSSTPMTYKSETLQPPSVSTATPAGAAPATPAAAMEEERGVGPKESPVTEAMPTPGSAIASSPLLTVDSKPLDTPHEERVIGGIHSVAKDKQLQDLMRANREKEAMTAEHQEALKVAAMDPLMTPEIDAGLGQLLSEWNLFKSSGIFGTGPSGRDHVLYKKLASMPMAAVVAGRFDGSTPKIKQNITDTMNGWRYNESIMHDPAETFEHYLRKVIRRILDRQKRK